MFSSIKSECPSRKGYSKGGHQEAWGSSMELWTSITEIKESVQETTIAHTFHKSGLCDGEKMSYHDWSSSKDMWEILFRGTFDGETKMEVWEFLRQRPLDKNKTGDKNVFYEKNIALSYTDPHKVSEHLSQL